MLLKRGKIIRWMACCEEHRVSDDGASTAALIADTHIMPLHL